MMSAQSSWAALFAESPFAPPRRVAGATALEPVWSLDDAVPSSLAMRWNAADADDVLVRDFARSMVNAGGFVLLLAGAAAMVVGFGAFGWALASVVLAVLLLIFGQLSHRLLRKQFGGFTAREIDLLMAHRRLVSFGDWDSYTEPDVPREVAAARRAALLGRELAELPGWLSEDLSTHRLRLDPVREAREIQLAAREIYDLRSNLESQTSRVEGAWSPGFASAHADWDEHLSSSWRALSSRLAAFERYSRDLRDYLVILEKEAAARSLSQSLASQASSLTVHTVGHEMAAADLDALTAELRALKSGLGQENPAE